MPTFLKINLLHVILLVILSMEKTMVAMVISELNFISRLQDFSKNLLQDPS